MGIPFAKSCSFCPQGMRPLCACPFKGGLCELWCLWSVDCGGPSSPRCNYLWRTPQRHLPNALENSSQKTTKSPPRGVLNLSLKLLPSPFPMVVLFFFFFFYMAAHIILLMIRSPKESPLSVNPFSHNKVSYFSFFSFLFS